MRKNNAFYKFRKDKEYQRYYKEASDEIELAIALTQARKRKGLTQAQLAKRTGMPQSQIARIESGNHNVTIGTLNRVASVLNLKIKVAG